MLIISNIIKSRITPWWEISDGIILQAPVDTVDITKHPSTASRIVPGSLALAVVAAAAWALKWKKSL